MYTQMHPHSLALGAQSELTTEINVVSVISNSCLKTVHTPRKSVQVSDSFSGRETKTVATQFNFQMWKLMSFWSKRRAPTPRTEVRHYSVAHSSLLILWCVWNSFFCLFSFFFSFSLFLSFLSLFLFRSLSLLILTSYPVSLRQIKIAMGEKNLKIVQNN